MTETKKKRPATKAAKPKQGDKPAMQKNTQSDIVVTEATIADLIPDDKNLNKGTQFGQHLIEKSLRELGAGRSLLLDKNNRIIAGNKTTENAAAIDLNDVIIVESDGTKLVAVKRTDIDLDSERGRKLALADNATSAANLEWDEEQMAALQAELDNFEPGEWGVNFEESMEDNGNHAEEDDFDENTDKVDTRCKAGDIWQLGEHRLICGDSTQQATLDALMGDETADCLITDPPNINYQVSNGKKIENDNMNEAAFAAFLEAAFAATNKHLKAGGAFYIWHSDNHGLTFRNACKVVGWDTRQTLIWNKNSLVLGRQDYQWKHEACLYGWKAGAGHYFSPRRDLTTVIDAAQAIDIDSLNKDELRKMLHLIVDASLPTTVIECDKPLRSAEHPTMKPIPLIAQQVKNSTRRHEIVLDIFGGSGTTLIAAEQLGRKCYMMELDPHYCDIIIARWEKLTNGKAQKIN